MGIRPTIRPRLHGWLGRPRQVSKERFQIVVEACGYRFVYALLKFLCVEPTCGEVITEGGDGTVSLGVTDSEWSLLYGLGLHLTVRRGPYPHHVPPGKVEPPRNVSSHD